MSLTHVEIEIANIDSPEITEKVRFLLDSGFLVSVIPTPILEKLGVAPYTQHEAFLPNGESVRRRKGIAFFRLGNRVGGADVLFGEEGDATILGSLALASLGLYLNPIQRELGELPLPLTALHESKPLVALSP